jgi:hypothetical protein
MAILISYRILQAVPHVRTQSCTGTVLPAASRFPVKGRTCVARLSKKGVARLSPFLPLNFGSAQKRPIATRGRGVLRIWEHFCATSQREQSSTAALATFVRGLRRAPSALGLSAAPELCLAARFPTRRAEQPVGERVGYVSAGFQRVVVNLTRFVEIEPRREKFEPRIS